MKILYVEDNPLDIDLTRRRLKKAAPDITMDAVGSQLEALKKITSPEFTDYDLVLTDMKLPDGDGIAILSHIRSYSAPVAVVLLTGQGDEETAVAALKAGANDYVIKKSGYLESLPQILNDALKSYQNQNIRRQNVLKVLYLEHNQMDVDLTRRHFDRHAPHIQLSVIHRVSDYYGMLDTPDGLAAFDVILLDYRLPRENALEVLKKYRLTSQTHIPVILITGKGDEEIAVSALKLGAFDYVTKNAGYLFKLPSVIENAFFSNRLEREHAQLQKSEARYRSLIDNIGVSIVVISPNMEVLSVNRFLQNRYPDLDLSKKPICYQMFNSPDRQEPCTNCPTRQTLMDGRVHQAVVETGGKGDEKYLRIIATPQFNENGEVTSTVEIADDITELHKSQEERLNLEIQLQQAHKHEAMGTLAGGIAHDFNNILSSIIGFAELAFDDIDNKAVLQDDLEEIYNAGKRARELVRQILTFSRHTDEQQKPVQVAAVLTETLQFLRATLPANVAIEHNLLSDALVMSTPTQIHQVIMNLCTNSAQAVEREGGALKVDLTEEALDTFDPALFGKIEPGRYLQLTVADTGDGIPSGIMDKIFEPYFTTKEPETGTGLGLAVVSSIVNSSGGAITVGNKPGAGAEFKVYLPITEGAAQHEVFETESLPTGSERILFVDDEMPIAKIGKMTLERLGYEVAVKYGSAEALEAFRADSGGFDLVITDMTMPGMTGDVLAAELMAVRPDIPVILCTGYNKKLSNKTVEDQGIKALVFKPIVKSDLAAVVRRVLDESAHPPQGD